MEDIESNRTLFGISADFAEGHLSLDEKFMRNRESTFFVRAGSDSMNPEIKDGDILIVDRSIKATSGAVVAIFFNGNPICKQLIIKNGRQTLHSFNSNYQDIIVDDDDQLQLFGVVTGLARDLL